MVRCSAKGVLNISVDGETLTGASGGNGATGGRRGSKNNDNSSKKGPKSPIKLLDPDIGSGSPCKTCKKQVGDGPRAEAIQCDRCVAWLHLRCTKLNKEEYEFLTTHPKTTINWFCDVCRKELLTGEGGQDDRIAQQGAKIDTLMHVIQTMQSQMVDMQTSMAMVLDNSAKKETTVEVEKKVETQVTEALEDQQEKEEKKNNIMIFNLPESRSDDEDQEVEDDIKVVKEVMSIVHPNIGADTISDKTITRLGRRKEGKTRPIKVYFDNDLSKGKVFRNALKLRTTEKFSKVNISNDKTKKELLADRMLRDKLNAEKALKPDEDLIIFRGEIIRREDRAAKAKVDRAAKAQQGAQA